MFTRALVGGGVLALVAAIAGGGIGYAVAGGRGLAGALAGALLAAVFLGLTTLSMLIGRRVTAKDPTSPVFFAIVAGGWLLKLILFVVVLILLRAQDALDPVAFGVTSLVVVVGSLVVDVVAFVRTRVPIDVSLPGTPDSQAGKD
jgi:hypothetical protein